MGLDWRPMGKPKPGYEARFNELYSILTGSTKPANKEELREEWFSIQSPTYETIKAPLVGRDKEADDWIKEQYEESEKDVSLEEFVEGMKGYYVILLAKELDGVPVYMAMGQDENVFRGKFLDSCEDLLGKELYEEAYISKMAEDTLKYGQQIMEVAEKVATEHNATYLKDQRFPPENWDTIEFHIHVLYSAAKWLIFYGKNGHGFEADY